MGHDLSRRSVTLAYDAGPGVGLGHRRRMEALAAALVDQGGTTSLVELGREDGPADDVVVVDSYRHRADDPTITARRRVAIDELGRDLVVDLVVDPSPAANGDREHSVAAAVLRGLDYALLDPALIAMAATAPAGPVERVLVTTGAADAAGSGARVAGALASLVPGVEVRLVEGEWGQRDDPPGVTVVRAPDGLAAELAGADVVVTAGGVTMLEALALGRPTVAFALAGNQRPYLEGLATAGAVEASTVAGAAAAAAELVGAPARRERLAAAGRAAVDGRGAARVAKAVAQLV